MDENLKKKIIDDFGLGQMDQSGQDEMIDKIGTLLFESVVERSLDVMDENLISQFEACIAESGEEYVRVIAFLKDNVPGFTEIVAEELARLRRATTSIFA